MALTWLEILTRVKQNVEDVSGTLYSSTELIAKVNEAKDDVLATVKIYTDEYPLTIVSKSFGETDTSVVISTAHCKVVSIEDANTGFKKWTNSLVDQNKYDRYNVGVDSAGQVTLFRSVTGSSESLRIYISEDVADIATTNSTATFTFGPKPADNLIVVKTTIKLLISRGRSIRDWLNREGKLEEMLQDNLGKLNVSNSRHVNYIPDDW